MAGRLGSKWQNRHASPGTHWCCRCQKFLSVKRFAKATKDLHGLAAYCKSCQSRWHKKWLGGLPEGHRMRLSWVSTRWRARHDGISYDLTFEQYVRRRTDVCMVCVALGLDCDSCADQSTLREVDRINSDPKIGYIYDNTQSLCWFHNRVKSDAMTTQGLLKLAKGEPERFQKCTGKGCSKKKHMPTKHRNGTLERMILQEEIVFPTPPENPKPPAPEPMLLLFELAPKVKLG
jgi:hypothetical protein